MATLWGNAVYSGQVATRDPVSCIRDFHAHVYFDPHEAEEARALCRHVALKFGIPMGHVHTRPVGPHPRGSCQLTVPPEKFGDIAQWLAINRGGFTVFVHPSTGDDVADHLSYAMWLGASETLIDPRTLMRGQSISV